jgi:hypothetical protein
MGDEQVAIHEIDVGLDAGETVREGVEKGTFVLVIIVGVGATERRADLGKSGERRKREQQQAEHECLIASRSDGGERKRPSSLSDFGTGFLNKF